ncbi:MAG: multidrug efflux pump subunit AcrB, partial [Candidatus Azotimanducaceae bacterium]
MNLAKISIDFNRITIFLLVMVLLMGIVMYESLSRDSMPPITIRVATIVSSFPGASP